MQLPSSLLDNSTLWFSLVGVNSALGTILHPIIPLARRLTGVYVIRHTVSGGFYIGSASDTFRRLNEHRYCLASNKHRNRRLQNAYEESHYLKARVFFVEDRAKAFEIEQHCLDLNRGNSLLLNFALTVETAMFGRNHSEETKKKIGLANTGRKHTEEAKQKVSLANTGRVFTEEHKKLISLAGMGRIQSAETRKKRSLTLQGNQNGLGHRKSEQAKEAIRQGNLGKQVSVHTREKIRQARLKWSSEHIDPRSKSVSIEGKVYPSTVRAAKDLGLSEGTVWYRLQSKSEKFSSWKWLD